MISIIKDRIVPILTIILLVMVLFVNVNPALSQAPIVHTVLFFSPTCSHCHTVMTQVLPPLKNVYGTQLDILEVDTTKPEGSDLYNKAIEKYKITEDRMGVPTMIINDIVLVGGQEIPDRLAGLIEQGVKGQGYDWPDIPGLKIFVDNRGKQPQINPIIARIQQDLAGNIIAIIVLVGLIVTLIYNILNFLKASNRKSLKKVAVLEKIEIQWIIAILVAIGVIAAAYLSYVELTQSEVICGPVGNCNAVQGSPYAKLFGILPIGILGLVGYVFIGIAWILVIFGQQEWQGKAYLAMWAMVLFGVLFSTYLTFLEPFVIGASCAWCLTSAIIMLALFWVTTPTAGLAYASMNVKQPRKRH